MSHFFLRTINFNQTIGPYHVWSSRLYTPGKFINIYRTTFKAFGLCILLRNLARISWRYHIIELLTKGFWLSTCTWWWSQDEQEGFEASTSRTDLPWFTDLTLECDGWIRNPEFVSSVGSIIFGWVNQRIDQPGVKNKEMHLRSWTETSKVSRKSPVRKVGA